jgi:hypothetical protein
MIVLQMHLNGGSNDVNLVRKLATVAQYIKPTNVVPNLIKIGCGVLFYPKSFFHKLLCYSFEVRFFFSSTKLILIFTFVTFF